MNGQLVKASFIRAPNDTGRTANDFGVAKVAVTNSHAQWAIPATWSGRMITIFPDTADVVPFVAFSRTTGREVSTAASAAADGAVSANAGEPQVPLQKNPMQLPRWKKSETMYLIAEAASNTSLWITLADGY